MRYCIDLHSYCGRRFSVFFHPHSKTNGNRVINCEGSDWLVIQSDSRNLTSQATYCFFVFFCFFFIRKKKLKEEMKPKKSHVRTHQIFALAHAWSKHIASSNTPQLCKPASDILKFQALRLLLQFRYGQLSVHIFAHMEAIDITYCRYLPIYLFIFWRKHLRIFFERIRNV